MRPYTFTQAQSVRETVDEADASTAFLAGGTTLVDLMKLEVMTPGRVVDINALPLRGVDIKGGVLHVGALERMSEVARYPDVRRHFPAISQALDLSASGQIRNMASIGGNLLQRTRCSYFRDIATPCNKRDPGSGCSALSGINRTHAVLGTSESCIATHPSDLAVALVALRAEVQITSKRGTRTIPLESMYLEPGDTPHVENVLRPGDLVTAVRIHRSAAAENSIYLKIRDRQSYEFALTSIAAGLEVKGTTIVNARIAAGGVGTRPWRLPAVENRLRGRPATMDTFEAAARVAADGAVSRQHNAFKPALLRRTLVRALATLQNRDS